MKTEPIPNAIYDELRQRIVIGDLPPGHPLTEIALAEQFKTSRTPVREALHRLEREGFADRQGRGLSVAARSPEEILDLYDFRALLEESSARWAAKRRTELDLHRLHHLQEEMRKNSENNVVLRIETNHAFHQQLWRASHNVHLVTSLEHIYNQLHRYPEITIEFPGRWEQVLQEHDELLAALSDGDPERSAAAARSHMDAARNVRLKLLSSQ